MSWVGEHLTKPEVLVAISQRGNPGESAVACLRGDAIHARRVGTMTNCQAAWFAAELALDVASEPIAIVSCLTELNATRLDAHRIASNPRLHDRDIGVISRVRSKWRGSEFRFRHKGKDSRLEMLRREAQGELDSHRVWQPEADKLDTLVDEMADELTESPLESVLLNVMRDHFPRRVLVPTDPERPWQVSAAYGGPLGTLIPQLVVGPYRGDFGIVNGSTQLFVEVDGYHFHDVTRDQLERDRKRDRYLMRAGWRVIRFTGREVHRDPSGCAEEVMATLRGLE